MQVTTLSSEDRLKVVCCDGESQLGKHLDVVLKRRGQLLAYLVFLAHQLATHLAMFVNVLHLEMTHIETHSQVF